MRLLSSRKVHFFVLACSIVLLPLQQAIAANPFAARRAGTGPPEGAAVRDIALGPGGVLRGQVVDAQGKACAKVSVRLVRMGNRAEPVAVTTTGEEGGFAFDGVRAGVYRVETPLSAGVYRLWSPDAAPPAASPAALVVQGDSTVRGNLSAISPLGWALIGVGIAAAIAIPLALDDDDAS